MDGEKSKAATRVRLAVEWLSWDSRHYPAEERTLEVRGPGREKAIRAAIREYTGILDFGVRKFEPTDDHKIVSRAHEFGYDEAWINREGIVMFVGVEENPGGGMEQRTTMMTLKQLEGMYGKDFHLLVLGSNGRGMHMPNGLSERKAVDLYERLGFVSGVPATAYATAVCVKGENGELEYHHGWTRAGYRWKDSPGSIEVVRDAADKRCSSATLEVDGRDVVITDPCYLLRDELRNELRDRAAGNAVVPPTRVCIGGLEMVMADTIYGDWLCRLDGTRGEREKETLFGTFTADSGMVCAAICADPYAALARIPKSCWTALPSFKGEITIVHDGDNCPTRCTVHGHGMSNGKYVKFSSRQIG